MIDIFKGRKVGDIIEGVNLKAEHGDYQRYCKIWEKCRDFRAGGIAVKEKGELYLPKLGDKQSDKKYREEYLGPAKVYDATAATVDTYIGLSFRKEPRYEIPEGMEDKKDVLDLMLGKVLPDGRSSNQTLRYLLDEIYTVNRVGVLEDYPIKDDSNLSYRDFVDLQLKWKSIIYNAENIINWNFEIINGEKVPVLWVLKEIVNSTDVFNQRQSVQYRFLVLEEVKKELVYKQIVVQELSEKEKSKNKYEILSISIPVAQGKTFDYIPFYIMTSDGFISETILDPLIYGLVELNHGHYRNSADFEHELHKISIKTYILPGWPEDQEAIFGEAIKTPGPEIKPYVLESQSKSPLSEEMTKKEERMATLGAQMLAQKGRYVQAAETARIGSTGEASRVAEVANNLSTMWTFILTQKVILTGYDPMTITVTLNTDYYDDRITPQELTSVLDQVIKGQISSRSAFNYLKKLEFYDSELSYEDEQANILEDQLKVFNLSDEKYLELTSKLEEMKTKIDELQNAAGVNTPEPVEPVQSE